MCVFTVAVRPTLDSYNAPFVFVSDPRVSSYFETITKKTIHELAVGLEGFVISGVSCKRRLASGITLFTDFHHCSAHTEPSEPTARLEEQDGQSHFGEAS